MHALITLLISWLVALAPAPEQKAKAELFTRTEGDTIRAAIRIKISPGWHLYHDELGNPNAVGKATTVTFQGDGITWSKARFPTPEKAEQPVGNDGSPTWIWEHHGTIVLYAVGKKAANAGTWSVRVDGLTCEDAGQCVMYRATLDGPGDAMPDDLFAKFPADLKLEAAAPATASDDFEPLEDSEGRVKVELFTRAVDGEVHAAVRFNTKPTWHIYHATLGPEDAIGTPTKIELGGAGIEWNGLAWPTPKKMDEPVGKNGDPTWIWIHEGRFTVYARGKLANGADAAGATVSVEGDTCSNVCVQFKLRSRSSGAGPDELFAKFPATSAFESVTTTSETPPAAAPTDDSSIDWDAVKFDDYQARESASQRSLGVWLFFAFVAGVLLNVMPCVLPVLSIKVLSFVQQAGESKARVFALGVAFAIGIVLVFVVLAAFAAFAGQGWGAQFQSEAFKITMVAVVFAFSLSLFDVYELGVPSKVGELASIKHEGLGDALFKGVMATVLATPCSGPFLGSTLTWALSQPALVVFAVFVTVGLGMAAPYVLLTANPRLLAFLPKPGAWMHTFKQVMGFVLLATVVFLMMSVRQDNLLFTVVLLVFVAFGCWWWGKFATFERTTFQRWRTLAVALAISAFGAWFAFGPFRGARTGKSNVDWQEFDPVALARYHRAHRPVMIDFTADWCFNCKTNKVLKYESARIAKLLADKGVVAVEADKSHDSPRTDAITRLQEQLGSHAIPFMAIFPGGDDWNRPYVFHDLVTVGEVASVLEQLPDTKSPAD